MAVTAVTPGPGTARRRTSAAVSGRTSPLARSASRSDPIRTRTSRRTGAPTSPNIRRSWRFQPWWIVTRTHVVRGSTAGSSISASSRSSVWVWPRRPVTVATPSVSSTPASSASACSRVSGRARADRVLALDLVARVEHVLGPVAVVGEQDQALGVLVQAPDRVQARAADEVRRDEVDDGRRGVPVLHGRGHARGLVHREVQGTPAGLRDRAGRRRRPPAAPGRPSRPSTAGRPSTVTRPADTSSSAPRRDATPAAARTLEIRSAGIGQPGPSSAVVGSPAPVAASSGARARRRRPRPRPRGASRRRGRARAAPRAR